MKSKWSLAASIVQLVFGLAAAAAFAVLAVSGEVTTKWMITLILAIAFAAIGITGIIDYKTQK